MTPRRLGLSPDDRRRLMKNFVVRQCIHHKKSKIDPPRKIALKHRIANMPTPHW